MLVLIDNYDSFSYNLYQQIAQFYPQIQVVRNDECTILQIAKLKPKGLIISPGPKAPKDAGICIEAISHFAPQIPILGVCLGHQAICESFGGKVSYAPKIMHGKSSLIEANQDSPLFDSMPRFFEVARYHSLAIMEEKLPSCIEVIARVSSKNTPKSTKSTKLAKSKERHLQENVDENTIMAIAHKQYKTFGVQFHPESILTPLGNQIIKNFLAQIG
ncbi:anthranilate synthase component II [Helicobacter macacae]|uniref:Glutamine amidotransferase domain-containing protein n=1 Tax=Helicobacter macacae MIT 99-5501 TaxID=1357400 RepID=V8CA62_9HELI|nr:aminodeoxychorismate/anthranilate synthase component II [Helicobacter macacae]ETD24259.1 hypothetical protein HMPREF2086_01009 [Helicobacter macacae MIT 99-5501]